MIKIVALMKAKPECVDAFKKTAEELVKKSRAEEGNIFYTLNEQIGDPETVLLIDSWEDQAAIDHHNATEHFTKTLPKLAALCEKSGPTWFFTEVEY